MKKLLFATALLVHAVTAGGQAWDGARLAGLSDAQLPAALGQLREFLGIPNNGGIEDHVRRNVAWTSEAFARRGFEIHELETGGPPVVVAERAHEGAVHTVLFYMHVDGQPVDPARWRQADPYRAVVKEPAGDGWRELPWERVTEAVAAGEYSDEWRVFARSASDDKSPVIMLLAALDILAQQGVSPPFNVKVVLDFEEERGSPHLPAAVERHQHVLYADRLVILDGPRHISNQPTLTFGARGITTVTLTVFGPRLPQHSGHYGNYAPNPALKLARLLASMKDDRGRVTIPGYYDFIELDETTRESLARVPDDEAAIRRSIGFAEADAVGETYQEALQYPSLNIRGLASGWVGDEARTIVPAYAVAEIDIRTVPESDPFRLVTLIREHIRGQGYHFVDGEPTAEERQEYPDLAAFEYRQAYRAFRTEMDSPTGLWLNRALERAFGQPPVMTRIGGGSLPIEPFVAVLEIPAVIVPTVNSDNNQHSPNENVRLGNFREGVRTCLAILTEAP